MGYFFIRSVMFTSNLVYSVIWNQSPKPELKRFIDRFDNGNAYRYKLGPGEVSWRSGNHLPVTSAVEREFLVLKYEKTKNRMILIDSILEGILYGKQYRLMCILGV